VQQKHVIFSLIQEWICFQPKKSWDSKVGTDHKNYSCTIFATSGFLPYTALISLVSNSSWILQMAEYIQTNKSAWIYSITNILQRLDMKNSPPLLATILLFPRDLIISKTLIPWVPTSRPRSGQPKETFLIRSTKTTSYMIILSIWSKSSSTGNYLFSVSSRM
jgi:hypothetical protein